MGNKRVFHACQGLLFNGSPLAGVQTLTTKTDNNQYAVESFGSFDIPKIYSDLPKSTISIEKILGSSSFPLYPLNTNISGVINKHDHKLCLFIAEDTTPDIASGIVINSIFFKDLSINNVSYNFSSDSYFTETIELIGYHKQFDNTTECSISSMSSLPSDGTVYSRQNIGSYSLGTKVPESGVVQSIRIDIPLNVNFIQEFGIALNRYDKKYRFSTLPIQIGFSATLLFTNNSGIDSYEFYDLDNLCLKPSGLPETEDLSVTFCGDNPFSFDLKNCILNNIDYNNGGADGSNVELTYSYTCYNYFRISQSGTL